ncbi:MAG: glycosyltransferase family 2 protein [bacterium]
MPLISIIVPVYNAATSLARCLDALLAQTCADIEILCIDDGSSDASPVILQDYAAGDTRVRVFSQANAGPAAARNLGLDHATGRYLMFCDSDDWYDVRCCARMHDTIVRQAVDVAVCQTQLEYAAGPHRAIKERYFNPRLYGRHELDDSMVVTCNAMLWNKIWRVDLIRPAGIRFPDGHEHDDDAFWFMYALEAKTIYFLSEPLYHHWIRTGSIMDSYADQRPANKHDRIRIARLAHAFATRQGHAVRQRRRLATYYRAECTGLLLGLFSPGEIAQLVDELNAAYLEKDRLYFFFTRTLTCVVFTDIQSAVWLRYAIACLASWVALQGNRTARKHERRYLRDVLQAKRQMTGGVRR